ncbi:hypothetical protein P154DRAFT_438140 [Amniculicola lignicola CBS 123094]|uniref:DUF6590 domain-containing protein n=1 Tax=Amniculicola lignicola CBS 123094 TaxID=1392246 RepID=A0A6A5WDU5_9PLEO|nr:hypothetical protein P154DRAFT_438140 [Amniculicola lignicola CBS 123094]
MPGPLPGELLAKQAIEVTSTGETLDYASRINFGRSHDIEHNVKLLEIGRVVEDHIHLLLGYFKQARRLQQV